MYRHRRLLACVDGHLCYVLCVLFLLSLHVIVLKHPSLPTHPPQCTPSTTPIPPEQGAVRDGGAGPHARPQGPAPVNKRKAASPFYPRPAGFSKPHFVTRLVTCPLPLSCPRHPRSRYQCYCYPCHEQTTRPQQLGHAQDQRAGEAHAAPAGARLHHRLPQGADAHVYGPREDAGPCLDMPACRVPPAGLVC